VAPELSPGRRSAALVTVCASLLVITIDVTILNVALPTLAAALDADNSALQWFINAYEVVFAGLLLTAGALADRFGRRRVLAVGLAVFWARLGAVGPGGVAGRADRGAGRDGGRRGTGPSGDVVDRDQHVHGAA
jgi:MFS family permease